MTDPFFGIDFDGVKGAVDFTKGLIGLGKDALAVVKAIREKIGDEPDLTARTEILGLLGNLAEKLVDAQIAQAEMLNRLAEMEAALKTAKREFEDRERYTLVETAMGGFVMAPRPDHQGAEPGHYLCQRCFADGKKRVLQPYLKSRTTVECPDCGTRVRLSDDSGRSGPGLATGDFDGF